jgi:hypothetical protein
MKNLATIGTLSKNNLPGDVVRFSAGGVEKVGKIYSSKNSTVSNGIWFEIEVRDETDGILNYYKAFVARST